MNRPASATYHLPALNEVADDFVAILKSNVLTPEQLRESSFRYATESESKKDIYKKNIHS